jgi:hypothetical protein
MADEKKKGWGANDVSAEYNEKTIAYLTHAEIIELNKQSRKGTPFDRSWRDNETNVL